MNRIRIKRLQALRTRRRAVQLRRKAFNKDDWIQMIRLTEAAKKSAEALTALLAQMDKTAKKLEMGDTELAMFTTLNDWANQIDQTLYNFYRGDDWENMARHWGVTHDDLIYR